MEKIDLMEIAKTIKRLGYKVTFKDNHFCFEEKIKIINK